jgi:DNA-binding transcriptional MerR regulator
MEATWTISELAEQAAVALAASPQQANGRVRDVPNERLIRWYVTVGLVDPPLSRRGRVARYGERHLLQLVAVKRRQAQGRPLAEIQQELAGATDEALAAVAGLQHTPERTTAPAAPERFWARPPSPPSPPSAAESAASGARALGVPGLAHGVRLAPGVVLLLDGTGHAPGTDDITAIVNAAQPLLQALTARGLHQPGTASPPEEEHEEKEPENDH